jgi:hypothetical protein
MATENKKELPGHSFRSQAEWAEFLETHDRLIPMK